MRSFVLAVASVATLVAGCTAPNPDSSSNNNNCPAGYFYCGDGQCAATIEACPGATPTPDMTPPTPDLTPPALPLSFDVGGVQFPPTPIGSTATLTVHATNTGSQPITLGYMQIAPLPSGNASYEFSTLTSSTCLQAPLAPGAKCSVDIAFKPQVDGIAGALLYLITPQGAEVYLPLSGSTAKVLMLSASPTPLTFDPQPIGQAQTLVATITNTGTSTSQPLTITVNGPGDVFKTMGLLVAMPCYDATLAPNETCQVPIIFTPGAATSYTGTLIVGDGTGSVSVALGGNGTSPAALSVAQLTPFPSEFLNASSPSETIRFTNGGQDPTGPLMLTKSATCTECFVIDSDGCSQTSLDGGKSCDVDVHFVASVRGNVTGSLKAASATTNATQSLFAVGLEHAYLAVSGTTTFTAAGSPLGTSLLIKNNGDESTGALTFTFAHVNNDVFSAFGCDGHVLFAGQSCTESISASPSIAGTYGDTLTIGNTFTPVTETLSATFAPTSVLMASAASETVGAQTQPFTFEAVTFWNTSAAPITLASTLTGSGFAVSADSCNGQTIGAGDKCSVTVTFTPPGTATFDGTLTVSDGKDSAVVTYTADGLVPAFTFNPASVDFGPIADSKLSAPVAVVVTNSSNRDAVTSYTIGDDSFAVSSSNCPDTLPAGQSCTMNITFGPRAPGPITSAIYFDAEGQPVLSLSGTGQ